MELSLESTESLTLGLDNSSVDLQLILAVPGCRADRDSHASVQPSAGMVDTGHDRPMSGHTAVRCAIRWSRPGREQLSSAQSVRGRGLSRHCTGEFLVVVSLGGCSSQSLRRWTQIKANQRSVVLVTR